MAAQDLWRHWYSCKHIWSIQTPQNFYFCPVLIETFLSFNKLNQTKLFVKVEAYVNDGNLKRIQLKNCKLMGYWCSISYSRSIMQAFQAFIRTRPSRMWNLYWTQIILVLKMSQKLSFLFSVMIHLVVLELLLWHLPLVDQSCNQTLRNNVIKFVLRGP